MSKDPIRCLDISSLHLTSIIQSILDAIVWPHSLSILCTCWLKECSEIHFQQNIIKPIQKSIAIYINKMDLNIENENVLRDISYIICLYFGQYGFHPFGEANEDLFSPKITVKYNYNARMIRFDAINAQRIYPWNEERPLIRGDENILHNYNNHGLWTADVYIKSLHHFSACKIGISSDKYIHKKQLKTRTPLVFVHEALRSCVVYETSEFLSYFKQKKETYIRRKINEQYNAEMADGKSTKKKKKSKFNLLNSALTKKKIQMKENVQFNYTDYLLNNGGGSGGGGWNNGIVVGRILTFDNVYHRKVEDESSECYKTMKRLRKDFAVWNQHRYVEAFCVGDIIRVTVNIKENWCRFYKNGVLQYHVDHLPYDSAVEQKDKGLWLFMTAWTDNCYVFDRKV